VVNAYLSLSYTDGHVVGYYSLLCRMGLKFWQIDVGDRNRHRFYYHGPLSGLLADIPFVVFFFLHIAIDSCHKSVSYILLC